MSDVELRSTGGTGQRRPGDPAAERALSPEIARDLERVQLAAVQLARQLRTAVPSTLSRAGTSTLAAIVKFGPISVSDLAAREGVMSASMSRTLTQLLGSGLVVRSQHESDGRIALFAATDAGREKFLAYRRAHTEFLQRRISGLDRSEVALITAAAAVLERMVELTES